jgi:hypothetical protein
MGAQTSTHAKACTHINTHSHASTHAIAHTHTHACALSPCIPVPSPRTRDADGRCVNACGMWGGLVEVDSMDSAGAFLHTTRVHEFQFLPECVCGNAIYGEVVLGQTRHTPPWINGTHKTSIGTNARTRTHTYTHKTGIGTNTRAHTHTHTHTHTDRHRHQQTRTTVTLEAPAPQRLHRRV